DVLQGIAAEIIASPEVEFDEGSRLAPGRRRPRLDIEARLLRALQENPVAARMIDLHRDHISRTRKPGNCLSVNVERLRRQIAVDPDSRARVAVGRTVLEVPIDGFVDEPTDTNRSVAPRDQKGTGKTAGAD